MVDDDRTRVLPARGDDARPASSTPIADGSNALAPGARVAEFEIIEPIGEGGFGIVYRALDHSLGRQVALKEYLPASLARRGQQAAVTILSERQAGAFGAGLRSFVNEARLLAQFDHPALVKVYRFWEAHGTAYMAMPFYDGQTLTARLNALGRRPDEAWLRAMLAPLFEVLELMHSQRCFHRDISPDNVLIASDDRPLLLDLGAARRVIGDMTQALTVILKPGYAPIEQYSAESELRQGPWTDVYGLGALLYHAISGKAPVPSVARIVGDTLIPASEIGRGHYTPAFLSAIDQALAVKPEQRPQSIAALREAMNTQAPPSSADADADADAVADSGADVTRESSVHDTVNPVLDTAARPAEHAARTATTAASQAAEISGASTAAATPIASEATLQRAAAPRTPDTPSTPANGAQATPVVASRDKALTRALTVAAIGLATAGLWFALPSPSVRDAGSSGETTNRPAPESVAASMAVPMTASSSAPVTAITPAPESASAPASVPASVSASVAVSVPASTPASRPPFSPAVVTGQLLDARAANWPLTASVSPATARIERDALKFEIRSARDGYVYVFMLGSDSSQWWRVFPNGRDQNNRVSAGKTLQLPRSHWSMKAVGPAGTTRFLVLASATPRDFSEAGLVERDGVGEFDLSLARAAYDGATSPVQAFSGTPVCAAGTSACDRSYAATVFDILEVVASDAKATAASSRTSSTPAAAR